MNCTFLLVSCSSLSTNKIKITPDALNKEFKKVCIEGTGKGRVELLTIKHTFDYESVIDKKKNQFNLVCDFPIVGEKALVLSLNPDIAKRTIKNFEFTEPLRENLGDRPDAPKIIKALEEFFLYLSDFLKYKNANQYPPSFAPSFKDGHFFMERQVNGYRFLVDSFQANDLFYERVQLKLFSKELSNDAIVTLFLVPQTCEK